MARDVCVIVGAEDRARLAAVVGERSRPHEHVARARIILLSADRPPVAEVARQAEVGRPSVWRWQRRYAEKGVVGLPRDKTRPPRQSSLNALRILHSGSCDMVTKPAAPTCRVRADAPVGRVAEPMRAPAAGDRPAQTDAI